MESPVPISGPPDTVSIKTEDYYLTVSVAEYGGKILSIGPLIFPVIPFPFTWFSDPLKKINGERITIDIGFFPEKKEMTFDFLNLRVFDKNKNQWVQPEFIKPMQNHWQHTHVSFPLDWKKNKEFKLELNGLPNEGLNSEKKVEINFKWAKGWVVSAVP